jgi:hypothetical protein
MTTTGWTLMLVTWAVILGVMFSCLYRLLRADGPADQGPTEQANNDAGGVGSA